MPKIASKNLRQSKVRSVWGAFLGRDPTTALNQGMPIVEISKILGHSQVETTMQYITVDQDSIKLNHRNCVI